MRFPIASLIFVASALLKVSLADSPTGSGPDPSQLSDLKDNPAFVYHRPSAAEYIQDGNNAKRSVHKRRGTRPVWSRRQEDRTYYDDEDEEDDYEEDSRESRNGRPGMAGKETARPPAPPADDDE